MIEIRTYDGEPAELAAFCTGVWRDRYRDKMAVPLWSGPFMDWELFSDEPGARDFLVAAYDGGRLVGALPSKPVRFQLRGGPVLGSFGSFFAIDPAYEKQAVSLKLVLEQRRRHRNRQAPLFAGFLIRGDAAALGQQFWLRLREMHVVGKAGLWVRMIDHRVMSDFLFHPFERRGARVLGWFQGPPKPLAKSAGIRPYRDSDLADCLRLANQLSKSAEFGLVWDEATLSRQLSFKDFPRTIVAEHGGRVAGFVNYFHQAYLGRGEMLAGVIDLLSVSELPPALRWILLRAALSQMTAEGCHTALFLHVAGQPGLLLARLGFVPETPQYDYVLQSMTADAPLVQTRSLHALWR
jgi:hypothetical protein